MRLNQYIAHSGLCSRRKADELIKTGQITINGKVIDTMGVVVLDTDVVKCNGNDLIPERPVYILFNKPKGLISTTSDEADRKTVLDFIMPNIKKALRQEEPRIYPVGRLDRNTTGLLILTNDGALTQALSHPSNEIAKVYNATLNKPITPDDFDIIRAGIMLDDGLLIVDEVALPDPTDPSKVGLALHSGKNRVVRRLFEALGYEVMKLDRVMYASLTKKNLPKGKWRFLDDKEVIRLKHFSGKKMENIKVHSLDNKPKGKVFTNNNFRANNNAGGGYKKPFVQNGAPTDRPTFEQRERPAYDKTYSKGPHSENTPIVREKAAPTGLPKRKKFVSGESKFIPNEEKNFNVNPEYKRLFSDDEEINYNK
jgi:pseudouridine synthase